MTAAERLAELVSPEAVDRMLAGADAAGVSAEVLLSQLTRTVLERALGAELDDHLGYVKGDPAGNGSGNSRNGSYGKTVTTTAGPVRIEVPRARNSSFEPKIVAKGQRRLGQVDEMILSLYARGMTTRDIQAHLAEVYGATSESSTAHGRCSVGLTAGIAATGRRVRSFAGRNAAGGVRPAGRHVSDPGTAAALFDAAEQHVGGRQRQVPARSACTRRARSIGVDRPWCFRRSVEASERAGHRRPPSATRRQLLRLSGVLRRPAAARARTRPRPATHATFLHATGASPRSAEQRRSRCRVSACSAIPISSSRSRPSRWLASRPRQAASSRPCGEPLASSVSVVAVAGMPNRSVAQPGW